MPLSLDRLIHQMGFEGAGHSRSTIATAADQTDTPAREAFDHGNADLCGIAFGDHLAFVERNKEDAAHRASPHRARDLGPLNAQESVWSDAHRQCDPHKLRREFGEHRGFARKPRFSPCRAKLRGGDKGN